MADSIADCGARGAVEIGERRVFALTQERNLAGTAKGSIFRAMPGRHFAAAEERRNCRPISVGIASGGSGCPRSRRRGVASEVAGIIPLEQRDSVEWWRSKVEGRRSPAPKKEGGAPPSAGGWEIDLV